MDQGLKGQRLIDAMIAGDDAAWCKFLYDIGPLLRAICLKAGLGEDEIEDIAQQVVLKLLERNSRALRLVKIEGDSLYRWSKVVISRVVVDHFRRKSAREGHEVQWTHRTGGSKRVSQAAETIETRVALEQAVGELSSEDRTVFWFRYRGLSDAEIARLLGVELATAQKRLSRMRKRLRKLLDEMGFEPWQ